MMLALFERVFRFIEAHRLIPVGSRVLIAYSGGVDSTVAVRSLVELSAIHRMRWGIELAHFNHGIDREDDDAQAVALERARAWNLPLHVGRGQPPKGMRASPQMAARKQRYRFLLDTCRARHLNIVVTAHHLDDQAETVLMRAIGGSWLTALSGIPLRRALVRGVDDIQVVRPLLDIARTEILEAAQELGETWFDDPSNARTSYTRNDVRATLMPLILERFNPGAKQHLGALAQQAAELAEELAARGRTLLVPVEGEGNAEKRSIDVSLFSLAAERRLQQRYAIREAMLALEVPRREITWRRVETALQMASLERAAMTIQLTATLSLAVVDGNLRLTRMTAKRKKRSLRPTPFTATPKGGWRVELGDALYSALCIDPLPERPSNLETLRRAHGAETEFIDAGKVEFPLWARARIKGDRFMPLGMTHAKKLQDYLVDRKVPREQRDRLPVVCDQRGILWVAGQGIADRVKVTDATVMVLACRIESHSDTGE